MMVVYLSKQESSLVEDVFIYVAVGILLYYISALQPQVPLGMHIFQL
jgi:hypothetical protein